MEKLELKHLAGYLPYVLKIMRPDNMTILEIVGLQGSLFIFSEGGYGQIGNSGNKPILRPLSDLTKEIEVNGEKFVPMDRLFGSAYRIQGFEHYVNIFNGGFELTITKGNKTVYADFYIYQKLYEWHFDIYGLIEKGLAIDINTLNQREL